MGFGTIVVLAHKWVRDAVPHRQNSNGLSDKRHLLADERPLRVESQGAGKVGKVTMTNRVLGWRFVDVA